MKTRGSAVVGGVALLCALGCAGLDVGVDETAPAKDTAAPHAPHASSKPSNTLDNDGRKGGPDSGSAVEHPIRSMESDEAAERPLPSKDSQQGSLPHGSDHPGQRM